MTLTKFFVGRAIVFSIIVVIGVGFFAYKSFAPVSSTEVPTQGNITLAEPLAFIWRYEKASTLNLDGLPMTNVFLEAVYPDGSINRKLIDTRDGGCNDLPDSDADSVAISHDAQCYAAGLGYHYKVTKGETSYLVQRKKFEEGSPDYTPPVSTYEVIAEFALSK